MRKLLSVLSFLMTGTLVAAQEEVNRFDKLREQTSKNSNVDTVATVYAVNFALGFNQNMLHNWAAGGELLSANVNGIFNGSVIKYNGKSVWTNNLDMAYGLFYAYSNSFTPRKTEDRIDFTSKYGYKLRESKDIYFTALMNAKTQFTKGYNYDMDNWYNLPTSGFLSPLYVTVAPGIEYRRGSQFSLFFSPAAMRFTFASRTYTESNPEGAFGVPYGKTMRFEVGSYLTARYEKEIAKGLTYRGRFDLYSNYLAQDRYLDGVLVKKDHPGNIDILWDNAFSYNFLKYFSINLGVLAIYDNDLPYVRQESDPTKGLGWWQIKQMVSIGFNYKL